jgi:hypothetical protein
MTTLTRPLIQPATSDPSPGPHKDGRLNIKIGPGCSLLLTAAQLSAILTAADVAELAALLDIGFDELVAGCAMVAPPGRPPFPHRIGAGEQHVRDSERSFHDGSGITGGSAGRGKIR